MSHRGWYFELVRLPLPFLFFFLMIRRPPRSTLDRSSAASDVYKRQVLLRDEAQVVAGHDGVLGDELAEAGRGGGLLLGLSLIHISEPTRPY